MTISDRAARTPWASPVMWYGALAVGLGVAVYLPIVHNYFHTEDFDVLHTIANRAFTDWVFAPSAGHLLVGRNLLFAAMYAIARGNPAPYFCSILLIHTVNTALLFAAIWTVTRRPRLACAGATAWAVTPVNEGGVAEVACPTRLPLACAGDD
jgi:hypothetical protein